MIEPADVHQLDTVVPGSELHGWEGTNTCRGSLKGGQDNRWAYLYSNGRAAAILDIPVDGPYVVTATMAARDDVSIGALTIDDQVVSEYKVVQSRTQPQHFEWKVNLEAGMHLFMFSFTNDIHLSYLRRDLYIREFSVFEEKAAAD